MVLRPAEKLCEAMRLTVHVEVRDLDDAAVCGLDRAAYDGLWGSNMGCGWSITILVSLKASVLSSLVAIVAHAFKCIDAKQ